MLVLEELQVGHLVASESVDDLVLGEQIGNLGRGLLVLFQLGQHLLSFLGVLRGGFLDSVKFAIERCDVVGHVRVLEKLDLARQDLLGLLGVVLLLRLVALELDEWE